MGVANHEKGIPVPRRTGKAMPTRNTRLYSVVEFEAGDERENWVSAEAKFSRLMTWEKKFEKRMKEKRRFTLSKKRTNKRWNETWIRRKVWISLNSFATKHVRQAETFSALPVFGRSQSMKKISIDVCRTRRWRISIVLKINETISRIRKRFCNVLLLDSKVLSYSLWKDNIRNTWKFQRQWMVTLKKINHHTEAPAITSRMTVPRMPMI